MKTTTPKRKRGQHVNKHPWSNVVIPPKANPPLDPVHLAWKIWSVTDDGTAAWSIETETRRMFLAFAAGYRAGKDAK